MRMSYDGLSCLLLTRMNTIIGETLAYTYQKTEDELGVYALFKNGKEIYSVKGFKHFVAALEMTCAVLDKEYNEIRSKNKR